ncbi:flavoprotein [Fodinicola feengrottensis]|uniref:Flavoprotein n=2 Tax=Fodinicola feengrottensis TaxID=435914 RepID=A0ABN2HT09_9ACTN|nr:flavoprotein [Fodinicola feengrottensis]
MSSVRLVVCGAPPARRIGRLVDIGHARGWEIQVIATPAGIDFMDVERIEAATLFPIRSRDRREAEPRSARADGIIVAPATFNTVCKLASGIADTYALTVLAEAIGDRVPTVVVPFVAPGMAARMPYRRAVRALHAEQVSVLMPDPSGLGPVPVGPLSSTAQDDAAEGFPFHRAADELTRVMAARRPQSYGLHSDCG